MIFSEPLFLWGLLALALPVVVHLFNFRRYRKVYFSNVDRLSELRNESRRRSTVRQWLVLLTRLLAVAFLVLAFARPVLPGKGKTLHSGATVVSVFVDNSFSMENSGADGTQLETAKQKAREIASAHHANDRYQLLSNDMRGEEFRWLSREEFLDAVDALQISPASHNLGEVVQRQCDFMASSGAANRHGYVVSDFQTSFFDGGHSAFDVQHPPLNHTLVPLDAVAADNLYIDTLVLDAPAYFVGGSVTVEVTVRNGGRDDVEKLPVKLFVDGRERAIATLDLPEGAAAKAQLRFSLDSPGWHDGRVEIADHPVVFDDSYYFTLLAGEPVRMLEVDGSRPNPSLQKLFASDSAVSYACSSLEAQFSDYDFIVLNELSALPSGRAQALAAWVNDGGTLLVVPSADGAPDVLNPLLSMLGAPQLEKWSRRQYKASQVDFANSLFRNVFSGKNDEMEMPSVQGRYNHANARAVRQSVISFADGADFLSLTPCGSGRLYLFSTPLSAEWTDFVAQALFVPTLYNMALYSCPLPPVAYTLGDPSPIFLQRSYDPAATPPELCSVNASPDARQSSFLPDIRRVGSRSVLMLHGELSAAGHYRLGDEHLAFNYDRRESQLEYLSPSEVQRKVADIEGVSVIKNAARPLDAELRAREGGTPLWRWCLLLALAALLAETLLLKDRDLKDLKSVTS